MALVEQTHIKLAGGKTAVTIALRRLRGELVIEILHSDVEDTIRLSPQDARNIGVELIAMASVAARSTAGT